MRTAQLMDSGFPAQPPAGEAPGVTVLTVGAPLQARVPAPSAAPAAVPAVPRLLRWLRGQIGDWLLGALSIGAVLLLWHLATLYRWEFYIRFNNIPTPAQVLDKVVEVNQSTKFLTSIGISLRRILLGFAVATLLGVALGLLVGR